MKDLGPGRKILGMELSRNKSQNSLAIRQPEYLEKVLKRFRIESAKLVKTPLAQHFKLSSMQSPSTTAETDSMKTIPYSNLVGSLMYTMVCCRLDLAYLMSVVSKFMTNPRKIHWEAAKCILRFVKGSTNKGLNQLEVNFAASGCPLSRIYSPFSFG